MKKIALFGRHGKDKYALVDDEDYELLSKYRWNINDSGYAVRYEYHDGKTVAVIRMHRQILAGVKLIDHRNGNRLDNRRSNLRPATAAQNAANQGISRSNTSGYKGVYLEKRVVPLTKPWRAELKVNGTRYKLGYFSTPLAAARAYNDAAITLHGEFAYLNKV